MENKIEEQDVIDVSLDIETLALDSKAMVISIGACTHDSEFHCYLDFASQFALKRSFNGDTFSWHLKNHAALFIFQLQKMSTEGLPANEALIKLGNWFSIDVCGGATPATQVWMNSPSFDSVILKSLSQKVGAVLQVHTTLPWLYKEERDLRTLKAMAKARNLTEYELLPPPPNNVHDALVDAKYQLEIISRCKTILNC